MKGGGGGGRDGRASGGPIAAGSAYLTGEYGPEVITGMSGYVHNASKSRLMLSSSAGDQHFYTIDARGTDPGLVAMHVSRAIQESQHSTVATSIRANQDRNRRTVSRSR
jgi:uncharacterized membrane protein